MVNVDALSLIAFCLSNILGGNDLFTYLHFHGMYPLYSSCALFVYDSGYQIYHIHGRLGVFPISYFLLYNFFFFFFTHGSLCILLKV